MQAIAPVDVLSPVKPRRSQRQNLMDIVYFPSTNDHALVCAFRPRTPERNEVPDWYLASLIAAPGADMNEVQSWFDEAFLDEISVPPARSRTEPAADKFPPRCAAGGLTMRATSSRSPVSSPSRPWTHPAQ